MRDNTKGKIKENKRMGKSKNGKMKEDKRNNIGPNIHIHLITDVKPQLYMSMQLSVPSAQSIGLALSRLYKPASQCATLSQTVTYL